MARDMDRSRAGQGRRLNDTRALAERAPNQGQSYSVSSRPIDNGYLIETHSYNGGTGESRCRTEFSPNPPRIMPARVDRRQSPDSPESLRDAVRYLGGDDAEPM